MKDMNNISILFGSSHTDNAILKYIASDELHEYDQDELIKAMNRQGLVQKEIQVRTKHGVHTRKQWVKASEDQGSQKPTKAQEDKKNDVSSKKQWTIPSSKQELAQMLASGVSREDIMEKAKANGITWKEHEHAGINWMRCSMALTGATTKGTKSDKSVKETETKQDNSDENKKNDSPDSTKSEKAKDEMKSQLETINQKLSNGERNCIMELQKFNSSLQEYVNSAIDESQGIYSEDAINDINKQLSQFTQSLGMNGKIEISLKKDKTMAYVNCTGITKNDSKSHKVMTFYSQDKNSGFWNSARNYEDFLKNQVKNSNLEVKKESNKQASKTKNQGTPNKSKEKQPTTVGKQAKMSMYNGRNIPYSLSKAAFGFSENLRRTKFPHIKNTGYQGAAQAFREIVQNAPATGKGICDALNSSGIGYINWKTISEKNGVITIQAEDGIGNKTNLKVTLPSKDEKESKNSQDTANKTSEKKGTESSTDKLVLTGNQKLDWSKISKNVRDQIISNAKKEYGQNYDISWSTPSYSKKGNKYVTTHCQLQIGNSPLGDIFIDTSNPDKPKVSYHTSVNSYEKGTEKETKKRNLMLESARAIQNSINKQMNLPASK